MEGVIALLTQAIAGAAGGNIVGQLAKSFSLGTLGNTVAGLAGGTGGAAILGMIVAPDGVLNPVMQNLIGGVFGGAALTVVAGLIKSMMGGKTQ
jgi:hypothetical protein